MTVATAKEKWSSEAELVYKKKLSYFVPFEHIEVRPTKSGRDDAESKKSAESDKILAQLKTDDYLVLFDERGQKLDSISFSKKIEKILGSGRKRTVLLVGGAYGVSEEVRSRAQLVVSFSDMVFNHLLAQTMVYEQVYRAFTIIRGLPYHNQ